MMPFSVLRMWGLGFLGWLLLGFAVYCLWEWADGVDPPAARRIERDADGQETTVVAENRNELGRDRQGGWPHLVAGLVLLGLSCGGGLPLVLLAGKPRLTDDP